MKYWVGALLAALGLSSCRWKSASKEVHHETVYDMEWDSTSWFDAARQRVIPIATFKPQDKYDLHNMPVVILSHGYNFNKQGAYLGYTFITDYLAHRGFYVVSIQHELPNDSLLPLQGDIQVVRRPFWERGADNIHFVLEELKRTHKDLDFTRVALIGHSNGGDMSALYNERYPNEIDKVITLDNRRVRLPRTAHPRVYSLRSSDMPADEGVLPTEEEKMMYGMTIIPLPNTIHNDMDNNANEDQRKEMIDYIYGFLTDKR